MFKQAAQAALLAGLLSACTGGPPTGPAHQAPREATAMPPLVNPPARRAFFGDLHLHTVMSFDAWTFGTRVSPDQAYKFGRGETVMVPAFQVLKEQGVEALRTVAAHRAWPLDFMAVTDHAEYLGALTQLDDPASAFSQTAIGKRLAAGGMEAFSAAAAALNDRHNPLSPALGAAADKVDGWAQEVKAANDNYQPGKFTTFVAYEWTAATELGAHMHRNIIFSGARAPAPFTATDSNRPEDLWNYLEAARRQGLQVLAIPHNSNLSDGRDFDWNMSNGRPIDEAYAQRRALNEPLVEISQTKGTSDTTTELSPNDEFADFEVLDHIYGTEQDAKRHGSYVREAYGRGLIIQSKVHTNPYKMGVVGGSDIHNGLSVSDENGFAGRVSGLDPKSMLPRGAVAREALDIRSEHVALRSGAAITGVWAEENTRESIFAALKRKETFATTGVRLRLRMFAGWTYPQGLLQRADWVRRAYADGVAMGSDLPPAPQGGKPHILLEAAKDGDGANLDRAQIIKIWLEGGRYRERVIDIAWSPGRSPDPKSGRIPAVGNTVNLQNGRAQNSIGVPVLRAEWTDPDFKTGVPTVYYARVLQIPTARWSTLLAIANGLPLPQRAPATIQERAWSSPIWYTPPNS